MSTVVLSCFIVVYVGNEVIFAVAAYQITTKLAKPLAQLKLLWNIPASRTRF